MSVSDRGRLSQANPPNVNLYCSHCDSRIGNFDNEWIRLTSTYARARQKGTHFGIETGKKIKVVPQGLPQKAAEGCGMSEVFCTHCSSLIGQYCRTAPNAEKQSLVDQYFYKLSRTYLKDTQTSERVDPVFGYGGDMPLPSSRSSLNGRPQMSLSATPGPSQTPLFPDRRPRDSLGTFGEHSSSSRPHHTVAGTPFAQDGAGQGIVSNQMYNPNPQAPGIQFTSAALSALKTVVEHHTLLIHQLRDEIRDLRARSHGDAHSSLRDTDGPVEAEGNAQCSGNDELNTLREENRNLKARFATIATAMGIVAVDLPGASTDDGQAPDSCREKTAVLGKRKRCEDDSGRSTLQRTVSNMPGKLYPAIFGDQLPTPYSTQGSNGDREMSFGESAASRPEGATDLLPEGDFGMDNDPSQGLAAMGHTPPNGQLDAKQAGGGDGGGGVVEFSDDETAGLHFPTMELVESRPTLQQQEGQMKELHGESPIRSASDTSYGAERATSVAIDLEHVYIFTPEDIRKQIEEEAMPKEPKEPAEPKERIQSTEKYLNAELEELGLSEWIGKDKKSAAFRTSIDAARTAQREAKKREALAPKGLKPKPLASRKPARTSATPVSKAPPMEPVETASGTNLGETSNAEPLGEITNQQQNKPRGRKARKPEKRASTKEGTTPKPTRPAEAETSQENETEGRVMTRRQQRESDIRKRDQMAQEAMAMEEA